MIRIAFLDYSQVFAGAERMLNTAITHLDKSKYECVIIFPYPMPHHARYDKSIRKIYLANSLKWWMGSDRWKKPLRGTDFLKRSIFGHRIANVIRQEHIDILDVNLMRVDIMMWVWASRRFTNAKITGHYRSQSQEWVAPAKVQQLFDEIACVSKFSEMRFKLKGDFIKTSVVYDAIDIERMQCDLTKEAAKQKMGFNSDDIILTSVGQLSLHKGHDTAIKAFARIANKYPTSKLLIAGGAGLGSDYYKQLAQEYGVGDRVIIPGKQFADIQTVYRAAVLTLSLTKVGEGFGLVPYESALLGTPFIAPEFGAIKEFVTDGETGILVDTNNPDAVTEKILFALENREKSISMVNNLKPIILTELSAAGLAKRLDNFYSRLYNSKR